MGTLKRMDLDGVDSLLLRSSMARTSSSSLRADGRAPPPADTNQFSWSSSSSLSAPLRSSTLATESLAAGGGVCAVMRRFILRMDCGVAIPVGAAAAAADGVAVKDAVAADGRRSLLLIFGVSRMESMEQRDWRNRASLFTPASDSGAAAAGALPSPAAAKRGLLAAGGVSRAEESAAGW